MAQLKAGSTVGGSPIATDGPAVVPTASLTISGTKAFGKYVVVKNGQMIYTTSSPTFSKGFSSGGFDAGLTNVSNVYSFPFSAPFTTSSSVGNLSQIRFRVGGHSSTTDAFSSGGLVSFGPPYTMSTVVDKFPFTAPFTTATVAGALSSVRDSHGTQSSSTDGFVSGGATGPVTITSAVEKFPFSASPFTSTSAGLLSDFRTQMAGHSSSTNGYTSGGSSPTITTRIDRFPFSATPFTATVVGQLGAALGLNFGHQSSTDGFSSGGANSTPSYVTTVYKFPFSAPFTTATTAGNLTNPKGFGGPVSSSTDGYAVGGVTPAANIATIEKFPFSAVPFTATTVGNLSTAVGGQAGHSF